MLGPALVPPAKGRWVVGAPLVEDTPCLAQVPADCTVVVDTAADTAAPGRGSR